MDNEAKILLVNPPFYCFKQMTNLWPNLGLAYCAAVLEKNGIKAEILEPDHDEEPNRLIRTHDINFNKETDSPEVWEMIKNRIIEFKPSIVAAGVTSAQFNSALKVAGIAKQYNPETNVVFGGPYPTVKAEDILRENDVDFVVRGDGEYTLLELAQELSKKRANLEKIGGLSWKRNGKIIHNKEREEIQDLDVLPFPLHHYKKFGTLHIITSRGCPNRCKFCYNSLTRKKLKFRSIENVLAEVREGVEKYGIKCVNLEDENFNSSKKRTIELCRAIKESGLSLIIRSGANFRTLDDELCKEMREAGFIELTLGVESHSDERLREMNKCISIKDVEEKTRIMHKNGMLCNAFFMFGLPGQTVEEMEETVEYIKRSPFDDIWYSMYIPSPGSEWYEELKENYPQIDEKIITRNYNSTIPFFEECYDLKKVEQVLKELQKVVKRKRRFKDSIVGKLWILRDYFIRHPLKIIDILKY